MSKEEYILQESFKKETERLYRNLIIIAISVSLLVSLLHIFAGNYQELFASLYIFIISSFSFSAFYTKYRKLSYHVIILGTCFLYLYMILVLGSEYKAILLLYPLTLIFCFIFMQKFRVLLAYLVFFIINQVLIIYHYSLDEAMQLNDNFFIESINIVFFNIFLFVSYRFYLVNLRKSKLAINEIEEDVKTQKLILEEKNKELEKYIASNLKLENYTHLAAHELKAPLRSIAGFSQMLGQKLEPKIDEKEKELFNFITDNSRKMGILLDDLNMLGKVSNESKIDRIEIDFAALIDEIKIDRRDKIQEREAIIHIENGTPIILGQEGLLKQLFSNLIGNALKFVEVDKQPIVHISSRLKGDIQEFRIQDNGIGIQPENRGKVFQIFTRLNPESKFKGSGIGLALCKKIVDLHKGTIAVDERTKEGTCFVIRIPTKAK